MVNYGRHVRDIRAQRAYYAEQLSEEDIKSLQEDLLAIGARHWFQWQHEESQLIASYLSSTQAQGEKLKKFKNNRPRLVLAALQKCDAAIAILRGLTDSTFTAQHDTSRFIINQASECFWETMKNRPDCWPYRGECPFET